MKTEKPFRIFSPRLAHPEQSIDFSMEVTAAPELLSSSELDKLKREVDCYLNAPSGINIKMPLGFLTEEQRAILNTVLTDIVKENDQEKLDCLAAKINFRKEPFLIEDAKRFIASIVKSL